MPQHDAAEDASLQNLPSEKLTNGSALQSENIIQLLLRIADPIQAGKSVFNQQLV